MARSTEKWIGKTDDTPVPPRVRLRQFERDGGCCCTCGVKIRPGMAWQCDHVVAIINGGANDEDNLQTLCGGCHKAKTAADVAQKAKSARIRARHVGAARPKSTMPGSRASGWKRTMRGEWVRRK